MSDRCEHSKLHDAIAHAEKMNARAWGGGHFVSVISALKDKNETLTASLARYEKALEAGDRLADSCSPNASGERFYNEGWLTLYREKSAAAREGGGRDHG